MTGEGEDTGAGAAVRSEFWDALAPHLAAIENNYLDISATRRIMDDLREPVLVVGAGQGLIVAEIRNAKLKCDGIDLSREMIRYAKLRRGIDVTLANARAMPIPSQTYETVLFATGVIDFTEDETAIRMMLEEGRRVVRESGRVFVAFYRLSAESEKFMSTIGLLKDNMLALRTSFEIYQLDPIQMVPWVAEKAGLSYLNVGHVSPNSGRDRKVASGAAREIVSFPGRASAPGASADSESAPRAEGQ